MGKINLDRLPSVIGSCNWGCNVLKRDAFDSFGQSEELQWQEASDMALTCISGAWETAFSTTWTQIAIHP